MQPLGESAVNTAKEIYSAAVLQAKIDHMPKMQLVQFIVIGLCLMINMLDGFDILAMSYAADPMAKQLSLDPQRLGLLFSASLLGMTLGAMFLAPFSDRIGRRNMLLICLTVISLTMYLTALLSELWALIIVRIFTGLGIGAVLASLTAMVAEYSPDRHRNLLVGLIQAGYPFGAVVGGLIAAWAIPEFGWRSVFIGGGTMTLLVGTVIWRLMPESVQFMLTRQPAGSLERINSVLQRLQLSRLEQLPPLPKFLEHPGVRALLIKPRRIQTLLLWSCFFLCFLTLYFLLSWVPKMFIDSGFGLREGIYAGTVLNIGGALGIVTLGRLTFYWKLQKMICLFLLGGAASMIIFALLPNNLSLLLVMTGVVGFLMQGGFVGLYSVSARMYPTSVRTTGIGWGIGLGRFGAVFGPFIAGVLISLNYTMASNFLVFSVPIIIAGILALWIRLDGEAA